MSQVIRVSLPGYNALTDTDPDHFALYSDEDWILVKEYPSSRGYVTVTSGNYRTIEIAPISHYPIVFVYFRVGNIWLPVGGQVKQYNDSTSTDNQFNAPYIYFTSSFQEQVELNLYNPLSYEIQFRYLILLDLQKPL